MASGTNEPHVSAASARENVAAPIDAALAAELMKEGPRGAFLLAGVSVGFLFVGWMLFYFLLFMPRGSIG